MAFLEQIASVIGVFQLAADMGKCCFDQLGIEVRPFLTPRFDLTCGEPPLDLAHLSCPLLVPTTNRAIAGRRGLRQVLPEMCKDYFLVFLGRFRVVTP